MKVLSTFLATTLFGCVHLVAATVSDVSFYACYSSGGSLVNKKVDHSNFASSGRCRVNCTTIGVGYSVQGMTRGTDCYCSQTLPYHGYKVDKDKCDDQCGGWPQDSCGSRLGEYWSVYLTGLDESPGEDPAPSSTSSASASKTTVVNTSDPSKPSIIVITHVASPDTTHEATPTAIATKEASGSSVNKAGIAAGCVVGVLAIIAVSVGAFIFLRKRRRQKIEEEYRRSAAVREFAKKPEADPRLDPGMIQRRDSVGSIADTQDYSRRILKVTNPDG